MTVVGNLPAVSAGEWLTAEGFWVHNHEHGFELRAQKLSSVPPTSREGIEKYLGSGMIKGIGPVYAKKMVAKFGEQVFEIIGKRAQGKTCPAIDGIIEEGEEILEEYKDTAALDAGLVAAAQAVEHYEITRYGTLKRWAQLLGLKDAVKLLDQNLQEESKTDESLTKLADAQANDKAVKKAA